MPKCSWKSIGKDAIFHIKKSIFFTKQQSLQSAWSIDQKPPENPQNLGKKRAKNFVTSKSFLLQFFEKRP